MKKIFTLILIACMLLTPLAYADPTEADSVEDLKACEQLLNETAEDLSTCDQAFIDSQAQLSECQDKCGKCTFIDAIKDRSFQTGVITITVGIVGGVAALLIAGG